MGPFATAAELLEWTGMPATAFPDLARIQALLQSASDLIRTWTDQTLSYVAGDTVILPAADRDTLLLPERPVVGVTSVVVDGLTLDPTTYQWDSAGRLMQIGYPNPMGSGTGVWWSWGATVEYDHGYAQTDPVWGELRAICMEMAWRAFTGPSGQAEGFGGLDTETIGFATGMFISQAEQARLWSLGRLGVG
jgi:hypothetical protein